MKQAVVIPLYNKAAYVEETLRSLARQTLAPAELILVDDASTDGSLEIAEAFLEKEKLAFRNTRIELLRLKKNSGPGFARNRGFEKTNSELVSFLDADDCYQPDFLRRVKDVFETHSISFLVTGIRYIPGGETDPETETLMPWLRLLEDELYLMENPLELVSKPAFVMGVGSNVVAHRSWMNEIRFDEDAKLNEGIDFWYRVLKNGIENDLGKTGLLLGEYLHVREVPGSLSRKKYERWNEIVFPPVVRRYEKSKNRYDKKLVQMISSRWIYYSLKSLQPRSQKLLFMLKYRKYYLNHLRRKLLN